MRRACHLLETTDLAISAVAAAVGYRDAGTLTKIFTRHIGRKPTGYRSTFRRHDTVLNVNYQNERWLSGSVNRSISVR